MRAYHISNVVDVDIGSNVTTLYANAQAFAAMKTDHSVVCWGMADHGGDCSDIAEELSCTETIFSNAKSFAAIQGGGRVVTWGGTVETVGQSGADSSGVDLSTDVVTISATSMAYAALTLNGSVITWGHSRFGGDSTSVASQLTSGVKAVFGGQYSFVAYKFDGSVVTWGYAHDVDGSTGSSSSALDDGIAVVFGAQTTLAANPSNPTSLDACPAGQSRYVVSNEVFL